MRVLGFPTAAFMLLNAAAFGASQPRASLTVDDAVAEMVRTLRVHGARKKYFNEVQGYNSRLDTLQAAILAVKLPHIDEANEGRRRVAQRYNAGLAGIPGVQTPVEAPYTRHVYHQYTIRVPNGKRDALRDYLKEKEVGTEIYYPLPIHQQGFYMEMFGKQSFSEAEKAAGEVLSLPVHPSLTQADLDFVAARINEFMA